MPAPNLGIKSVTDRYYRGPCLTAEQLEPVFNVFRSKKSEMLAAVNTMTDLGNDARIEVRNFLNDFFSAIDRPSSVKQYFINGCKRSTM